MESFSESGRRIVAACVSSSLLCTLLYPLDLVHARMSTDMTKKESMYNKGAADNKLGRTYANITDCIKKT